MQRATSLSLMLLVACTAPTPAPEPIIEHFIVSGPSGRDDADLMLLKILETHGIRCDGVSGSTKGSRVDRHYVWRTTCSGTERQWTRARADIARLTADGLVQDMTNTTDA